MLPGKHFIFKKGAPDYVPHWEIRASEYEEGAKLLEVVGTPEQKINYYGMVALTVFRESKH